MTPSGPPFSQLELDRFVAALLAMLDTAPDDEATQQQLLRLIIRLARLAPDDGALHDAVRATMAKTGTGTDRKEMTST